MTKQIAAEMGRKGGKNKKGFQAPNTIAKIEAREALRRKIEADMEPLYDAWKDSALGHFTQVKTATGMMKVYKEPPNAVAIRDMFERAFGKPEQKIEGNIVVESQADMVMAAALADLEKIIEKQHANDDGGDDQGVDAANNGDSGTGAAA